MYSMLAHICLYSCLSPDPNVWFFISWENLQNKTVWNINYLKQFHIIIFLI